MSLEAWGDEDPSEGAFDAAIEAGWIDPRDQTKALIDVMNERARQQDAEGWTPEHDDQHNCSEMAYAAAAYILGYQQLWPIFWDTAWLKLTDKRRDLVKAGALILAEIERLDRAEKAAASSAS